MMGFQKLVVVASQQPSDPLGELEVVVAKMSKIPKGRQFSAPDGELPALARSRGEKVPFGGSRWSLKAVQPEAEVHPFPGEEHLPWAAPSWQSSGQAPPKTQRQVPMTSEEVPSVRLLSTSVVVP